MESHDTLQQMANLANMLIIGKELPQAREFLRLYEALILEYETDNDYLKTVYQYLYTLYIRWRKPELAEKYKKIFRIKQE